jgi:hypothetical protein
MNISLHVCSHTFNKCLKNETSGFYNQFTNWIKGEFDLYQIEESEGLSVYFPNGFFNIRVSFKSEKYMNIMIKIKSRTLNDGKKIENKINSVHSNLKKLSQN